MSEINPLTLISGCGLDVVIKPLVYNPCLKAGDFSLFNFWAC